MKIEKIQNGREVTLAIDGELDTITSPDLRSEMDAVINDIDTLKIDCTKLSYISSAGLRVFLQAYTTLSGKGGKMILANVNEQVKETLTIVGMMDFFQFEGNL